MAEKNWLKELVIAVQKSNKIGAASGPIYYLNPSNKIWFAGGKVDAITGFFWHSNQHSSQFDDCVEIDTLCGCALVIKREVLNRIGLFYEGYFLYGDDIDLSFNIRRLKMKLIFI